MGVAEQGDALGRQGEGRFIELLHGLKLGVGNVENACKQMGMTGRGGAQIRREFMEEVTETHTEAQFKWEKDEGATP